MSRGTPRRATRRIGSGHSQLISRAVIPLVIIAGAVAAFWSQHNLPCHEFYRRDVIVSSLASDIYAEAAKTDSEKLKGLSGRACIGPNQGVLFFFDGPGSRKMWMKDMKFPIDIVWIGSDKKVITVKFEVEPSTYPETFTSTGPAQYVLELKAGQAEKQGILTGSVLTF